MIPTVTRVSPGRLLAVLTVIAAAAILLAVATGSTDTGFDDLWQILRGRGDAASENILLQLRGPRALAAFGTGAMLALAGVLMQVLLRNPLADPSLIGVSSGASAGASLAIVLGGGAVLAGSQFAGLSLVGVDVVSAAGLASELFSDRELKLSYGDAAFGAFLNQKCG